MTSAFQEAEHDWSFFVQVLGLAGKLYAMVKREVMSGQVTMMEVKLGVAALQHRLVELCVVSLQCAA